MENSERSAIPSRRRCVGARGRLGRRRRRRDIGGGLFDCGLFDAGDGAGRSTVVPIGAVAARLLGGVHRRVGARRTRTAASSPLSCSAAPRLTVTFSSCPLWRKRSPSTALRSRSTVVRASATAVPGRMTTNSSPP